MTRRDEQILDVAVLGGGPAGLEAALVLARSQRTTVVFEAPGPARNAASHGVHNLLGLDGLLPARVREVAWEQVAAYGAATLRRSEVVRVTRDDREGSAFVVETAEGERWRAKSVIAAFGYRDEHPDIPGFEACWGGTVIPCPFCDGWENRGRAWGIVPTAPGHLALFPRLALHWAAGVEVVVPPGMEADPEDRRELESLGVRFSQGRVVALEHDAGRLHTAVLDGGRRLPFGTLLWRPPARPAPLLLRMVEDLGLRVGEDGTVPSDGEQETNVRDLYVAGDLQGWAGAVRAAAAGHDAAVSLVKSWYRPGRPGRREA